VNQTQHRYLHAVGAVCRRATEALRVSGFIAPMCGAAFNNYRRVRIKLHGAPTL
jgi:hypothetical protein